jgi:hypothetical protein
MTMASDDKGLVLRGFFLLAVIGTIVSVVLAILFMRPQFTPPPMGIAPENLVPLLVAGCAEGTPCGIVFALADRMPSAPGWEIRYNAATTLARRGSSAVPWALMRAQRADAPAGRRQRDRRNRRTLQHDRRPQGVGHLARKTRRDG